MQKIIRFTHKRTNDSSDEYECLFEYLTQYNSDEHIKIGLWIEKEVKECIIEVVENLNKLNRCNIQIIDNTCENKNNCSKTNENPIKIDLHHCAGSSEIFNKYIQVLHKYSINDKVVLTKDEWGNNHAIIEVKSLDFLPKLECDLRAFNSEYINGLIFSTINKNHYSIEVYDGYRE